MLSLQNVNKSFEQTPILCDLALTLAVGQSMALIGESGSGKSTLLNIVAGLESFDAGLVRAICAHKRLASYFKRFT
jgi:ABC-type sulfate/molybdate transport systems ATPase subunit